MSVLLGIGRREGFFASWGTGFGILTGALMAFSGWCFWGGVQLLKFIVETMRAAKDREPLRLGCDVICMQAPSTREAQPRVYRHLVSAMCFFVLKWSFKEGERAWHRILLSQI